MDGGRALPATAASCLSARTDAVRWTFEVEVPRRALSHVRDLAQHTDAACTAFGCATMPPEDARCATGCKAWPVTVHVAFEHLPVP